MSETVFNDVLVDSDANNGGNYTDGLPDNSVKKAVYRGSVSDSQANLTANLDCFGFLIESDRTALFNAGNFDLEVFADEINIANVANLYSGTGGNIVRARADLNISNSHSSNVIPRFSTLSNLTITKIGDVYIKRLTHNQNTIIQGNFDIIILNPTVDDFIFTSTGIDITGGSLIFNMDADRSQGSLDYTVPLIKKGVAKLTWDVAGVYDLGGLDLQAGAIDTNTRTTTLNGNLIIASGATLTDTGAFTLNANGNISNPNSANIFLVPEISAGVTITQIDVVWVKNFVMNAASVLTGVEFLKILNPTENNFIQLNATSVISNDGIEITLDIGRIQTGINIDSKVILQGSAALTTDSAWDIKGFEIKETATFLNAAFGMNVGADGLTIPNLSTIFACSLLGVNENANIANPNSTNLIGLLGATSGKTATIVGDFYCQGLINNGIIAGTDDLIIFHPTINNFIVLLGTINTDMIFDMNVDRTQPGFGIAVNITVQGSAKLTFTTGFNQSDSSKSFTIASGAHVECDSTFAAGDFICAGEFTVDDTKSIVMNNISGAGTLHSKDADIATIFYNGSIAGWTGTLDNVVLQKLGKGTQPSYYGMRLADQMDIRL